MSDDEIDSTVWRRNGSDEDESDNYSDNDDEHNDYDVTRRNNNSDLLSSIFSDSDSDDDNTDNEREAATKLLEKDFMIKRIIMDSKGENIELKCMMLVIRKEDASKEDGVLVTFFNLAAIRKLCRSLVETNHDMNFDLKSITRNITRSALAPILGIKVNNKSKAHTIFTMISVQDAINFLTTNFIPPYFKKSDNIRKMMEGLDELNNPTIVPSFTQQLCPGNDPLKTLIIEGKIIQKPNFII